MAPRTSLHPGELLLSVALAGLGIFVIVSTQDISAGGGYSQVGPRAFPYIVGSGLILLGGILCWHAASGGWRNVPMDDAHEQADWPAFAILSAGVLLHMASIAWAGFILASAFLFTLVARGFGSRRLARDILVGIVLATIAYFVFTRGLGLNLPAGLLGGAST